MKHLMMEVFQYDKKMIKSERTECEKSLTHVCQIKDSYICYFRNSHKLTI